VGATGAIILGAADAIGRADDLSNRWYADLDKAIKQWDEIVVGQPIKEIQENARALLEDLIKEFEALHADVLHANAEINSLLSQLSPRIDGIRRQLDFRPELQDGRDRIASELFRISAEIGWLYFRFPLSLRMVEEMLAARGIDVSYKTVRQRGLKFGEVFARRIRQRCAAAR